jgi:adenosine deaminase
MAELKQIPKSDLHNHFVLGGNREYIFKRTGFYIPFLNDNLHSMQAMHDWSNTYINNRFNSFELRKILIEAAFYQAKMDGIKLLEIGEDVWALGEFFNNDVSYLLQTFKQVHDSIAPEVNYQLQIGLSRHCPIDYLEKCLKSFWSYKEFYSIDLYGDELVQPIQNFMPIYQKAKECGLRLKAHIGEWGTANDIIEGIELLQLDEVQHGIAAADSLTAMDYLKNNNIRLNICPTSNMKLGRIDSLEKHPIQKLYRYGVDVTINSDDVLAFDSDVSKEYLRLYQANTLSAEDLNEIRLNGLHIR